MSFFAAYNYICFLEIDCLDYQPCFSKHLTQLSENKMSVVISSHQSYPLLTCFDNVFWEAKFPLAVSLMRGR